ncbi:MAG: RDD family protein [Candidatus Eremiobacteraeota bacterium]|nr:RDD family protein [Candidatus Eremiobacteraeota bacterium]
MGYCPECLQERVDDLARCPLDRAFYVEVHCRSCGAECWPREKFCGACGAAVQEPALTSPLEPASLGRRVVATLVDSLALFIIFTSLLESGLPALALPLVWIGYYAIFQAGGRRTVGQALVGSLVLSEQFQPLNWRLSLLRSLSSLVGWLALFGLDLPGRWTSTREWRVPEL